MMMCSDVLSMEIVRKIRRSGPIGASKYFKIRANALYCFHLFHIAYLMSIIPVPSLFMVPLLHK